MTYSKVPYNPMLDYTAEAMANRFRTNHDGECNSNPFDISFFGATLRIVPVRGGILNQTNPGLYEAFHIRNDGANRFNNQVRVFNNLTNEYLEAVNRCTDNSIPNIPVNESVSAVVFINFEIWEYFQNFEAMKIYCRAALMKAFFQLITDSDIELRTIFKMYCWDNHDRYHIIKLHSEAMRQNLRRYRDRKNGALAEANQERMGNFLDQIIDEASKEEEFFSSTHQFYGHPAFGYSDIFKEFREYAFPLEYHPIVMYLMKRMFDSVTLDELANISNGSFSKYSARLYRIKELLRKPPALHDIETFLYNPLNRIVRDMIEEEKDKKRAIKEARDQRNDFLDAKEEPPEEPLEEVPEEVDGDSHNDD